MTNRLLPNRRAWALLPILIVAVTAMGGYLPANAQSRAAANSHSYVVLDNNGRSAATNASPCSSTRGCANGIRFDWTHGVCVSQDRFSPIAIVWMVNHKVALKSWPLIATCSTGIQLTWGKKHLLTKATWRGSSGLSDIGMTVCFQHRHQCSPSHCVTSGCLPKNVDGAYIFFQGGDALKGAQWLRNGKTIRSISISARPNDVYWFGQTPPKSLYAHTSQTWTGSTRATPDPKIVLLGRDVNKNPQSTTSTAPPDANGVNFKWFLAPSGRYKQCVSAEGHSWTYPPATYEYTTGRALNSRMYVLTCPPASKGILKLFNGIDLSWKTSSVGTKHVLSSAVPTFNGKPMTGVPELPQPPAGTDGLIFEFHHDNYESSSWTHNGNLLSPDLSPPGHTRMATWGG